MTTEYSQDDMEHEVARQFITSGCECTKARGMQCCEQLSPLVCYISKTCAKLSHYELEMTILGQLAATNAAMNTSYTLSTECYLTGRIHFTKAECERWYTSYFPPKASQYAKRYFTCSMA